METDTQKKSATEATVTPVEPVVIKFAPQEGPQTAFMSSSADIVLYGGARGGGKSYGLELDAMRYTQNEHYGAVLFRRTMEQVFQEGGLWETSERIFPYAGAEPRRGDAQWVFPSGSTITFGGLEHEDSKYNWLGSQIAYLGFDQLESFTASQFWFMLGCNRSPSGIPPCIRATANPEPGWLAEFIQWWWDADTGYPILERSGIVRWFVRVNDAILWGDDKAALEARWPNTVAKSFTFIPSFVDDNKILLSEDPTYKANLLAQGTVERERWLKGNWKIKMTGGLLLKRGDFKIVTEKPARFTRLMRYWDLAATEETDKNKNPCYTAGGLVGLVGGQWFIMNIKRIRANPPDVENLIKSTASIDPGNTETRMEKEGGASGKTVISHYQRNILPGFNFSEGTDVWQRKSKTERAKLIASAARAGNVFIVKPEGGDNEWIENFLTDCDSAPDGWMDMIDCISGAFVEMRHDTDQGSYKRVPIPEHDEMRVASVRKRGIII